jgi:hypothetical protein
MSGIAKFRHCSSNRPKSILQVKQDVLKRAPHPRSLPQPAIVSATPSERDEEKFKVDTFDDKQENYRGVLA